MNTNDRYVAMTRSRMKAQRAFYKAIRKDPDLAWLCHLRLNGELVSTEYCRVRNEMCKRDTLMAAVIICVAIEIVFSIMFALISHSLWQLMGFAMLILGAATIASFIPTWNEMFDQWLNSEWKTKEFYYLICTVLSTHTEVLRPANAPKSWQCDIFYLRINASKSQKSEARGIETLAVTSKRYLELRALRILRNGMPQKKEDANARFTRIAWNENDRQWLKHVFEVYQRLGLISDKDQLRIYYSNAERALKQETTPALT